MMRTGKRGLDLIRHFEGFAPRPYTCPAGHCTVGYGEVIHRGPCKAQEVAEFVPLTEYDATLRLLKKLEFFEAGVRRLVKVPLTQNQFDALVSFAYNLGLGALEGSTLLRKLNQGDYDAVPGELARWNKAAGEVMPGLVRRREAEGLLWAEQ
jgi:lysozyme